MKSWLQGALNRRNLLGVGLAGGAGALGFGTRRLAAALEHGPGAAHPGAAASRVGGFAWRDDDRWRGRSRPQRLRSPRHPHRLGHRRVSTAAGRPAAARVRDHRRSTRRSRSRPASSSRPGPTTAACPGPTLRATEGERVRIRFANAGSHPHSMHFHGIHSARMDGVPGAGEVAPGRGVRLRVRRQALRLPPLSLPLPAAEAAHPQGPLRRLHHRPRPGAPSRSTRAVARSRLLGTPENARWQEFVMVMNAFDTNFDDENEVYAVNTVAHAYAKRPIRDRARAAGAGLPGQRDRVRPDQLLPPARQLLRLLRPRHDAHADAAHDRHGHAVPGAARHPRVHASQDHEPGLYMFHAHQSEFVELGWMSLFDVVESVA